MLWGLMGIGGITVIISLVIIFAGILSMAGPKEECVGIIKIEGEIVAGSSDGGLFASQLAGSDDITALIEEANGRSEVKAVLIELNSGGGSPVGSREIYESLKRTSKPKVAYFREVAASGAYYVAVGTDYIVSDPDALTGSIGVRATRVDMTELFQKIGYNQTVLTSGDSKAMGDPSTKMSEEEMQIWRGIIDEMFQEFKGTVEAERGSKLNQARFQQVLDARIVTGRQAKQIGLVDEIGNKRLALRKAAELANMSYDGETPRVCVLSKNKDVFSEMFSSSGRFLVSVLVEALRISTGARGVRLEY